MKVLIIEDDLDIAGNIGDFLGARGHTVDFAYDGIAGMHLALTDDFDALVVDLMLPGMSGIDLCRKLRREAKRNTPTLMLTARDTLDDKLEGFAAGADDYLVKPFALQELEARLQALQRRGGEPIDRKLRVADLSLDPESRRITRGDRSIELPGAAFEILQLLMERSPNVVRRREIEELLWPDEPPQSDVLRSHIYAMRSAIDRPFGSSLLKTLRGVGYRLAPAEISGDAQEHQKS